MQFIDKYLNKVKIMVNKLCGRVNISENIINNNEKKLLHISDTPACIYPYIFKIIEELNPDIIIHTGDLVDNIKLGNGASLGRYIISLEHLLRYFEKNRDKDIYIVPGNHDSIKVLRQKVEHVKIIKEGSVVNIHGIDFGLAHFRERLPLPLKTMINLYGHSKEVYADGDKIYLNGLLSINIILLPSLYIEKLAYPLKTDNARKYKTLSLP